MNLGEHLDCLLVALTNFDDKNSLTMREV